MTDIISSEVPSPSTEVKYDPSFRDYLDTLARAPARLTLNSPTADQALVAMAQQMIAMTQAHAATMSDFAARFSTPPKDYAQEERLARLEEGLIALTAKLAVPGHQPSPANVVLARVSGTTAGQASTEDVSDQNEIEMTSAEDYDSESNSESDSELESVSLADAAEVLLEIPTARGGGKPRVGAVKKVSRVRWV